MNLISRNKWLLIILCVAFTVRLIQLMLVCTISGDGPVYLEIAKNFYGGNFRAGLAKDYPPLYPMLITTAYTVTGNWIVAGRFVSFLFSILTIIAVYFLAKDVFGGKIASVTAVFTIFQPSVSMCSVRIVSEPSYLFFFVLAVWLSWKALNRQQYACYFWAGAMSGLSYLVRPEGLGVAIVTGLYTLLQDFSRLRLNCKKKILLLCVLSLGALIFVAPYVLYLRSETGKWKLSKKKSIVVAFTGTVVDKKTIADTSLPPEAKVPAYSRIDGGGYIKTLFRMIIGYLKVYNPFLIVLLLLGLVRRKSVPWQRKYELFIGAIVLFYLLVLSLFYVTDEHLVPLIPISLFWASIGFYELYDMLLVKLAVKKEKLSFELLNRLFIILLGLIVVVLLPYALRPQDRDKIGQKKVGLWIKENCKKSLCILTDSSRLAFYAKAKAVRLQNRPGIGSYEYLIKFIKSSPCKETYYRKIDYVVIDSVTIGRYCPDFLDKVKSSDLEKIYVQPKLKNSDYGEFIVYRVLH